MKKVMLLALMAIILFSSEAIGQYKITGKILNSVNDQALQGANIIMDGSYKATVSDRNGEFKITGLSKGNYNLIISYMGYETIDTSLSLSSDFSIEARLKEKPINGEEVIISATRAEKNTPTTYTNLSIEEIEEVNLGQDLPYMMELTPSAVVTSDAGAGIGYTGIRIRGSDITRINVTINGVPLNDPESQGVFFVNMPDFSSSIQNMQIQRGVGTSTNGAAAFGASINIQTLNVQAKPYASVNASFGSFNTFRGNVMFGTGLLNNKIAIDGRLSYINSDGYIDRASSKLKSYYLSGTYAGKNSILKLITFSGTEKTYQAWDGVPSYILPDNRTYNGIGEYTDPQGNKKYYDNETDNYQQDHYQLHYTYAISDDLSVNATAFHIRGKGYYEQYKVDQDYSDYGLQPAIKGQDTSYQTDLVRQKWLNNSYSGVNFSFQFKFNPSELILGGGLSNYDGDHYGKIIWAQNTSNADVDQQYYFNNGIKSDFNVFLKYTHHLNEKLDLYGDLQYRNVHYNISGTHDDLRNITQDHYYDFFNPKVGVFYELGQTQSMYFSYAMSNREPSRSNFRDADEGDVPQPERLNNLELGYNLGKNSVSLNINAFYMGYKDQLVLTGEINDVGAPIMTNVSSSFRAGLEMMVGWYIVPDLKWEVNLTYSQNKIKDFTEYVDNWDTWSQDSKYLGTTDIAFSPDIIGASQFGYTGLKNAGIFLSTKYVGKQYIDNTSSDARKLNAYFVNNLRLEYSFYPKVMKKIALKLMINNIFNEMYESNAWIYRYNESDGQGVMQEKFYDGYFPQAGINFLFGVGFDL